MVMANAKLHCMGPKAAVMVLLTVMLAELVLLVHDAVDAYDDDVAAVDDDDAAGVD